MIPLGSAAVPLIVSVPFEVSTEVIVAVSPFESFRTWPADRPTSRELSTVTVVLNGNVRPKKLIEPEQLKASGAAATGIAVASDMTTMAERARSRARMSFSPYGGVDVRLVCAAVS